jgi:hypothetical protein
MRKVFLILFLSILSCKKEEKSISKPIVLEVRKEKTVDEILSELSTKDTIYHLDLSNKGIDSLIDLSSYKIESLDLSFNNLDTIPLSKLPLTLKKLKCTNNNLKIFIATNYRNSQIPVMIPFHNSELNLAEIDLSHNKLKVVTVKTNTNKEGKKNILLRKVLLSNNNIQHLNLEENLEYLDISNNLNLPSEVFFSIDKIDTLLQNNNHNKIKTKRIPPPPVINCVF